MATIQHTESTGEPGESLQNALTDPDDFYDVLANRRRRFVLHHLQYHGEQVEIGTLAEQIAAWENQKPVATVTFQERKRTYTALQQRHLPKLSDAGLIRFDDRAGVVQPTPALSEFDIYTEVVSGKDFPWSQYYLGLAAVSTVLMITVAFGALPATSVSPAGWGLFCAVSFFVSALVHTYVTRNMKLGDSEVPPEIEVSD